MTTIETPLKGLVGDKTAKALAAHLDLHTVGDLIYHFPRRYDERGLVKLAHGTLGFHYIHEADCPL